MNTKYQANEIVFLKLGGSLITNKHRQHGARLDVIERLATEIKSGLDHRQDLRMVIGHGAGSLGHFEASQYDIVNGVSSREEWLGFVKVAGVTEHRNSIVLDALLQAGIPAISIQPSASAKCYNKNIIELNVAPLIIALRNGLCPLVRGDIAFDEVIGGTIISTEEVFRYLAGRLKPRRILLAGQEEGVLDAYPDGNILETITPSTFDMVRHNIGGSKHIDVTGGMFSKVDSMLKIVSKNKNTKAVIYSGNIENLTRDLLVSDIKVGTTIIGG